MGGIFVYVEHRDGKPKRVAYELLGKGAELSQKRGEELTAVVLGDSTDSVVRELGGLADRVLVVEDPSLSLYNPDLYLHALLSLLQGERPSLIMAGFTSQGRDLFPRLAGHLGVGIAVDCLKVDYSEGEFLFTKPYYGSKVLAEVTLEGEPKICLVRPRSFPPVREGDREARVERVSVDLSGADQGIESLGFMRAEGREVDLTEADVVVCGGMGLKSPENFKMLEELAEVLGGVVGATRAVVDAGWRPQAEQVGKSGKTVSPNLYFAIGLSGAIHHVMGMDTSKVVVAINKDPLAPIFEHADYGLVADLFEVLPLLIKALREELQK